MTTHQPRLVRRLRWLPVLAAAACLAGCGSATGSVSGKVSHKGQPLSGGTVMFIGDNNQVATAPIGSDGRYAIAKAPVGTVKIAVAPRATMAVPQGMSMDPTKVEAPASAAAPEPPAPKAGIPDKYKDPDQSGLTYTVKPGKQQYDIDLP